MLEFSKRLGICLGIAAAFCLGACGDDDSSTDKGKSGGDNAAAECTDNDDCKDVEGKPVCDTDKGECIAKSDDGGDDKGDGEKEDGDDKVDCSDTLCGSDCVDLKTDANHCGDCDTTCKDGKSCIDSKCDFACSEGQPDKCDDGCHDFKTDNDNCGKCGEKCNDGKVCKEGVCTDSCENTGDTFCDGTCTDLMSDSKNCGACGTDCTKDNKTCQAGECKATCQEAGQVMCPDGQCYFLDSDTSCGTCESHPSCDTSKGEHCSASGKCEDPCPDDGYEWCNNTCINYQTNKDNCGACGHKCDDGLKCSNGECLTDCGKDSTTNDDLVDCSGQCINPKTDKAFCGAKDKCAEFSVCGEGQSCSDGQCKCSKETDSVCQINETESICVDPKTDSTHCGCGSREGNLGGINCAGLIGITEGVCENGTCKLTCDDTHLDCDQDTSNGCEADLTSLDHCGACNNACNDNYATSKACIAGQCQYVCKEGMSSCDGHCVDTQSDINNCGWCGNKCEDGTCVNGFCTVDSSNCKANDDGDMYVTTKVSGTEIKAFCIRSAKELESLAKSINAGGTYPLNSGNKYFLIANDIDLGTVAWTPIGTESKPFSGVFLGNGKLIKGTLSRANSYTGLFGKVLDAQLIGFNLNLNVSSDNVCSTCNHFVGGLAGYVQKSFVKNSKFNGTVIGTGRYVGGLIGNGNEATVENCSATGKVASAYDVGGVIGTTGNNSKLINLDATNITVTHNNGAGDSFGGLVGHASLTDIKNCHIQGKIDLKGKAPGGVGGLVGSTWNTYDRPCTVEKSSADVEIESSAYAVGGLYGYSRLVGVKIKDSFATGKVSGNYQVGGLLGYVAKEADIENTYATGEVNATANDVGGLIGYVGGGSVKSSYATGKVTVPNKGQTLQYTGGLIGRAINTTMTDVHATGDVGCAGECGGLVGQSNGTTINNAYATGKVSSTYCRVGGLVGMAYTTSIDQAFALGNVSGQCEVASIVGWFYSGDCVLSNSFAVGDVTYSNYYGGFIGRLGAGDVTSNITLRHTYMFGTIKGGTNPGAMVGYIYEGTAPVIKNSYYWKDAAANIYNNSLPKESAVFSYKVAENEEAVVEIDNSKLVNALGDKWVSKDFKFTIIDKSVPGIEKEKQVIYKLPTLKAVGQELFK